MVKRLLIAFISLFLTVQYSYSQYYKQLEPVSSYNFESKNIEQKEFKKGVEQLQNKSFKEAIKTFESIVEGDGEHAPAVINLGIAYYQTGQLQKAKKQFDRSLEINEALHWAWFGSGLVSFKTHHPHDAAQYFAVAHQLDKDNEKYAFMYGVALKKDQQYMKALQVLKKSTDSEKYKSNAYLEMGNVYAQQMKYDKSIEYYDKAEANGASKDMVALNKAKVSSINKSKSTENLDNYVDEHPKDPNGFAMRGNILLAKGQSQKAIDDFNSAIELNDKMVNAYNGRAAASLRMGQYQEALQDCNKAIKLDPNFAMPYYNRGIAKEMLRDVEGACYDWEQAFFMGIDKAEKFINSPTCNDE